MSGGLVFSQVLRVIVMRRNFFDQDFNSHRDLLGMDELQSVNEFDRFFQLHNFKCSLGLK